MLTVCAKRRERLSENCEENVPSTANDSRDIVSAEKPLSINIATFEKPLRKLTYQHLWEATDGFIGGLCVFIGACTVSFLLRYFAFT